jgi:undecaprenyl-diphosphatase
MSDRFGIGETDPYAVQLFALIGRSASQLVRPSNAMRRTEAAHRLRRQTLWLFVIGTALVLTLMFGFDAAEISLMPPRGDPDLWPARVVTDFGKDSYVMTSLASALVVLALAFPLKHGVSRARLLRVAGRIEYLLFAVAVPIAFTEVVKYVVGRGRPFVGGKANPFNFAPLTGAEPYFSFPSAHAVTAFALAIAVAAIWPKLRPAMLIYAFLILASRLVLLAHHPSDVVGGAVVGILGALAVRHWFAVRGLGFAIGQNGEIVPR